MPTNFRFLRTAKKRLSHSLHAFFRHTRPSCTFSFTKAPRCLKLLIPASNAIGRWGITVELSPECSLNRNNWFVLHKLQHTKRLLLRSRHHRFVTSQTEREGESGIAHAHKTWTHAISFHVEKRTSACVLVAVMADWNRSNHFDTPCICMYKYLFYIHIFHIYIYIYIYIWGQGDSWRLQRLEAIHGCPMLSSRINPLNPELNPMCCLLALLGAHHFLHVSRIRVKLLTFRRLMLYIYIYGAPVLDVSRSHTTTQHSR